MCRVGVMDKENIIKIDTLDIFEMFQEGLTRDDIIKDIENQLIDAALELTLDNQTKASEILGMSRSKLIKILRERKNDN